MKKLLFLSLLFSATSNLSAMPPASGSISPDQVYAHFTQEDSLEDGTYYDHSGHIVVLYYYAVW